MSATPARWVVPRIVRNHLTKRLKDMGYQQSPQDILSRFPESTRLTVKQSSTKKNRFFMYEEHSPTKLQDDDPMTPTITTSPMELANLLSESSSSVSSKDQHHVDDDDHCYYYWTSPISTVAPHLLREEFNWYQQLHHHDDDDDDDALLDPSIQKRLDPRGPSLWMGTFGSGTQCHYDVANNVVLQLHGTKRIRCFPPHVGVTHFHVFPDAHPKARKSQVDLDINNNNILLVGNDEENNKNVLEKQQEQDKEKEQYPHFVHPPAPFLDVTLHPGDAIEIPAFWFHHVENGLPRQQQEQEQPEPSVSLNSFVLSEPMMIAQQIFQKASLPMNIIRHGNSATSAAEQVPGILRELGVTLITSLGLVVVAKKDHQGDAIKFIQRNLLQARYGPLMMEQQQQYPKDVDDVTATGEEIEPITEEQRKAIERCVQTIRSDFDDLVMEGIEDDDDQQQYDNVDENGIVLLVALHLLELWAVQMVGAHSVHEVWKKALR